MEFFQSLAVARIIFVLGIFNLVVGLLIFFSCRCLHGSKIGSRLTKYRAYNRVFRYHCYIWKVFWPSITVHAFFALMFFGWPG